MSTFKGLVAEFPDIQIDFFRKIPQFRPPLACFLSHVHSDHLAGLDTLKSPFVYCSPATREILLRLEKYPHRMNFALQILESRKQTYKHLDKLLKPIPLETPTKIELTPGNFITVTLFDANHCPGAVMFLIENDEHSILYTGDLRSEPSFVTNLRHNPHLIEYTTSIKTLDCIYLDTSNTDNISFPSKAEGLSELLQKVSKYPQETVFHMSAWTYGYEEVWMALSKVLKSQIHVDRYKMRIYKSLVGSPIGEVSTTGPFISREGPVLTGFQCGNVKQDGCLTENPDVRIHSCEKDLHCPIISNNSKVVWITPIVTRTCDGQDVEEVGIGGGGGDLVQRPELELSNTSDIETFLGLLDGLDRDTEDKLRERLLAVLLSSRMAISLDDLGLSGLDRDQNEMPLTNFADLVSKSASNNGLVTKSFGPKHSLELPRKITFPYSRHSSFPELCDFVAAFKPKDVYPCTVDESEWHEGISIRAQFGRHCSDITFRHDLEMRRLQAQKIARAASVQTHTTESSEESIDVDRSSFILEPAKVVRKLVRDDHGRLRLIQRDDKHHDVSNSTARHKSPHEIVSKSPGSQSQSLRRKLILQDLDESRKAKRAKVAQTNGPGSSPLSSRIATSLINSSEDVDVVSFSVAGAQTDPEPVTPGSSDEDENGINYEIEDHWSYLKASTFYDPEDKVQRCLSCGHEMQSLMVRCERCDEDAAQLPPYFEVYDSKLGSGLEYAFNEYDDKYMDQDDRLQYVGAYLDNDSSAYDSQDEDRDLREEYEVDSFIDDASEIPDEADEVDPRNEDTDWETKFRELQEKHDAVVAKNTTLRNSHDNIVNVLIDTEEKYYGLLDDMGLPHSGDEEDDDDELDEQMDEEGNILVNPPVPIPAVHELVLSSAQDQSQNSEVSDERLQGRIEAFEAVRDENEGWHSISLLSTHNHTEAEIEL